MAKIDSPQVIVIAGPNGAGKSTLAPYLLRDTLGLNNYVNADTIAQGLAAFEPQSVAIEAGRYYASSPTGTRTGAAEFRIRDDAGE